MLSVLAFVTLLMGTMLYNRHLRHREFRQLMIWAIQISFISGIFGLLFVLRINVMIGINDLVFIIFTSIVTDTLILSLRIMPVMVLFAKITPHHIEATVFAFLTGVFNFSLVVISPMIGAFINRTFVNVTTTDLSNFYVLCIVQIVTSVLPLTFVHLVPTKQEIAEHQAKTIHQ
jgi:hypothetical protein